MKKSYSAALLASTFLVAAAGTSQAAAVKIDGDDIGGVVKSANGPEAGVWVIAETQDLNTQFIRIVVTDDEGRYVVPDLPEANYKVWVRGYGLVDSDPVDAAPGQTHDLAAVVAPNEQAAAEVYPAQYWYSLVEPPAESEFPGTGPSGNGISPGMFTQQHWLHHMQENCMFCHQMGTRATRSAPDIGSTVELWDQRVQKARGEDDIAINNEGQALATTMNNNMTRFGRQRGLQVYADWSDRINAGAVPPAPPRPSGIERNVVVTVRDYAEGRFTHDMVASDRRDPTVNGGGPMYGLGMLAGWLEILDPNTNTNESVPIPGVDPKVPHDETAKIHHNEMDEKGRVWMAAVYKQGKMPEFCSDPSNPYANYFPQTGKTGQPLPMYDPATEQVHMLQLCSGGNHASFTFDEDSTVFLSSDTRVVSWLKTKVWDETGSVEKAHGWCPMVLDTNGDGTITPNREEWNPNLDQIDPEKDTQFTGFLYGINSSMDGIAWAANYIPYVPSRIVRMDPGSNPPETCHTEIYEPPKVDGKYLAYGVRGIEVDKDGVAWAAFSSGHIGKFDRSKCETVNGPNATGQHCPEGWEIFRLPGPTFTGTEVTPNFVYGGNTDFTNSMGLGENTVFFPAINSDSILAMPEGEGGEFLEFRVAYPQGFYTRDMHFRVDDPDAGWKGRAVHATYSMPNMWHMEEGEGSYSKIATFQIRPDPLAH